MKAVIVTNKFQPSQTLIGILMQMLRKLESKLWLLVTPLVHAPAGTKRGHCCNAALHNTRQHV